MPLLPKDREPSNKARKPQYGYRAPHDQAAYIERLRKESGWDQTRVMSYLIGLAKQLDESLGSTDSKRVAELADKNHLTIGEQIAALVKQALAATPKK